MRSYCVANDSRFSRRCNRSSVRLCFIATSCTVAFFVQYQLALMCTSAFPDESWTGPDSVVPKPSDPPPELLERHWDAALSFTRKISSACPDFVLFTVAVISPTSERHHELRGKPNISLATCAVFLSIVQEHLSVPARMHFDNLTGWNTVSIHSDMTPKKGRKISRFPKLYPAKYFPYTHTVLYCDTKWIDFISKREARLWAEALLDGTSFGIVQHPRSTSFNDEHAAILHFSKKRPAMVDNKHVLQAQVEHLNSTLTTAEKTLFAVEGKLHAHVLGGKYSNSKMFDLTWLSEYLQGSDRDQIAFFAASARMKMKRVKGIACDKLDYGRAGFYLSGFDPTFSMRIHCDFDSLL